MQAEKAEKNNENYDKYDLLPPECAPSPPPPPWHCTPLKNSDQCSVRLGTLPSGAHAITTTQLGSVGKAN
jgi:hypothetical protein